jgi:hypothetical protein
VFTTTTNTLLADNRFLPQRQQQQILSFDSSLITYRFAIVAIAAILTKANLVLERYLVTCSFHQTFAPFHHCDLSLVSRA